MIISASRRTDIPSFYSEWFMNRIREGFLLVPNPHNPKLLSRVRLDPAVVDCIVFWTKNAAPMIGKLDGLSDYKYYFQYTLNPYGKEIEENLPPLTRRIETFKRLSDKLGREKVVWRYDPLFTNQAYGVDYHKEKFAEIAEALKDHTEKCMLGFIDHYYHIRKAVGALDIKPLEQDEIEEMALSFKETAGGLSLGLDTCTVKVDLRPLGIPSGLCVDKALIERIAGYSISARKDKNQREICNCIESIDIGTYESCLNGCIYCYAIKGNYRSALSSSAKHDPHSPLLIGSPEELGPDTVIKDREMKSLRTAQQSLFPLK